MCYKVVINRGEKEIETPREFQQHFGFYAEKDSHYNSVDLDICLCQCDVEKTFKEQNIQYKHDGYDYYVGLLDGIDFG